MHAYTWVCGSAWDNGHLGKGWQAVAFEGLMGASRFTTVVWCVQAGSIQLIYGGPCSRLLKTFKSSDFCLGLVGYFKTIRIKGLGSDISSFAWIWASQKHKTPFFCPDAALKDEGLWCQVTERVSGVAPVHKLLQRDNRRPAVKQRLNTYNQHLQKWCWDSFPRALAWLSSDCSFLLLLGSACLPVEKEKSHFNQQDFTEEPY